MANTQLNQSICILVLIFGAKFITASDSEKCEPNPDDVYVIRSRDVHRLVLDATDPQQLRVQNYTGDDVQLWKFKPAGRIGLYFIVNVHHGKVLDFNLGKDGHFHAAVNEGHQSVQQTWSISIKGQIVNVANENNIDIDSKKYTPGNRIILWKDNGCECQKFLFEKATSN